MNKDRCTEFIAGSARGTSASSVAIARRVAIDVEGDCAGSGGTDWHGDRVGATLWAGGGSGFEVKAAGTAVLDGPDAFAVAGTAGALDFGGRDAAWIHPDQEKARKSIAVPLNADALAVVRAQIGKHDEYVFTYLGRPVTRTTASTWYKAVKRCGLEDFRWHDLRHTWASWHVQSGTPLQRLMELGGWANYEMVLKYAHLAPGDLAEEARRIERMPANSGLRLVK